MGAQVAQMGFGCPGSGGISGAPIRCVSAVDSRDVMPTASLALALWQPRGWVGDGMGCSYAWSDPAKQDWSRDMTHSWSKWWEWRAPCLGSLEESRNSELWRINLAPELGAASPELKDREILRSVRNIWNVENTTNSGRLFVVSALFPLYLCNVCWVLLILSNQYFQALMKRFMCFCAEDA